jgi:serpin B
MDRRTFLALAPPALAALLQACGNERTTSSVRPAAQDSPVEPTVGPSPVTPAPSPTEPTRSEPVELAAAGDPLAASGAFNEFGRALYEHLVTEKPSENLVFSPASIALALAMTSAGARGLTLSEMLATLQVPPSSTATVHSDVKALTDLVGSRNSAEVALTIANSLWGQQDLAFEQAFLDTVSAHYGAGLQLVDYRVDPEAARAAINRWVSDQTKARIPELLPAGTIHVDTRLALVNAIYMKAPWESPFLLGATEDLAFTRSDGSKVTVPTMRKSAKYTAYATGLGWRAIEMSYIGGWLSMVIVLPDRFLPSTSFAPNKGSSQPDQRDATLYDALTVPMDRFDGDWLDIALPRFDIEFKLKMKETLGSLGIVTAFRDSADFSGITTQQSLKIDDVIHQANITVDEVGTEAAAATAVTLEPTSGPPPNPVQFIVDRPFLFAVRERASGAVLFAGRVADPSITR